ncbi:ATP-grasp domain-containing protein [Vibrio sagamiensis]|uniref:ATP-grasp domain-containing protein n=1 Tax=Vibrio sagamiensis NBRC 104589 TaxID=1219064 RepID=A0A511QGG8_9VIBR|nr:ATP-grasp domain-containing protein [Vibrio sagamiensis]PNQ56215.1 ATP-grasp domain-containing protein [Vibrio agarivorans]GEM76246.1 hypothetical protein VSA01S_23580 [Vibrio sagamiensis NBRC 104589]
MKVLVIGNVRPGHKALVKMGHQITVLMKKSHGHEPDIKFPYENLMLLDDDASFDTYIEIAAALHGRIGFERMACFNDTYQEIAALVANKTGISYPHNQTLVKTLNNKFLTRQCLASKGMDDTPHKLVYSAQELQDFYLTNFAHSQKSMIVKPLEANASLGVSKVDNLDQLEAAINKLNDLSLAFPVIAEAFLTGKEFSVEVLSEGGLHLILGITEKIKDEETFIELGHVFPAELAEQTKAKIEQYVCNMLDALGVRQGPSHTEIILTDEGPKIVETHARVGGDGIFTLIELATGVDIYECEAKQSCGVPVLEQVKAQQSIKQTAAILFSGLGFEQTVHLSEVHGLEEAKALEGIENVSVLKKSGDLLPPMTSSRERTACAMGVAQNQEQALALCKKALNTLSYSLSHKSTW